MKNIVYARISSIFRLNYCSLHESANVISGEKLSINRALVAKNALNLAESEDTKHFAHMQTILHFYLRISKNSITFAPTNGVQHDTNGRIHTSAI